jgi:hypothetical protein
MHGARLRERKTVVEAQPVRRCIDRHDDVEVLAFAEDDESRMASGILLSVFVCACPFSQKWFPLLRAMIERTRWSSCLTPLLRDSVGR